MKLDIFKLDGNVYAFYSSKLTCIWKSSGERNLERRKVISRYIPLYCVKTQIPTFFHTTTASQTTPKL